MIKIAIILVVIILLYLLSVGGRKRDDFGELEKFVYAHRGLHNAERPENSLLAFGAAVSSAVILFLVGVASLFSYIMTFEGVARMLQDIVTSAGLTSVTFLLIVNGLYLIMGMLMETVPIIILTAPIFFPIATSLGIDPVHFGVITVVNLAFGLFTPPFGTCVFMASSYSKQPVMSIVKDCRMFYIFGVLSILFITYMPGSIMWILNLLG